MITTSFANGDSLDLCTCDESGKSKCKWTKIISLEDRWVKPKVPYKLDDHVPSDSQDISYDALK